MEIKPFVCVYEFSLLCKSDNDALFGISAEEFRLVLYMRVITVVLLTDTTWGYGTLYIAQTDTINCHTWTVGCNML